jgi:hypothetical protein
MEEGMKLFIAKNKEDPEVIAVVTAPDEESVYVWLVEDYHGRGEVANVGAKEMIEEEWEVEEHFPVACPQARFPGGGTEEIIEE